MFAFISTKPKQQNHSSDSAASSFNSRFANIFHRLSQGFMVWKFPRKNAEGQSAAPAKNRKYRQLTDRMMNQILVDKMKSTYQNDFLGIPQGKLHNFENF